MRGNELGGVVREGSTQDCKFADLLRSDLEWGAESVSLGLWHDSILALRVLVGLLTRHTELNCTGFRPKQGKM